MPTENQSSNTELAEKLSPCPFCGETPQITKHHREDIYSFMHRCQVLGPISWGFREDQYAHIEKWNSRAQPVDMRQAGSSTQRHENDRAEQHQGEPVGEVVAFGEGLHEIAWTAGRMPRLGAKLYTKADPNVRWKAVAGEQMKVIEQQRSELGEAKGEYDRSANKVAALRAQLAELETLLHEVWPYDLGTPLKRRIKAALSASAEPSAHAWTCQPCKIEHPTDRPCDACGGATELKI